MVEAVVADVPRFQRVRRGLDLVKFRVADETGHMQITFFNQAYRKDQVKQGETYIFYGKVGGALHKPEMTNPIVERAEDMGRHTGAIIPIYRLTQGLSQTILSGAIRAGLQGVDNKVPDPLPPAVVGAHNLAQAGFAYQNLHFPQSEECLELARRRLIFEELFLLAASLAFLKEQRQEALGTPISGANVAAFLSSLPYRLTGAQKRAIDEALADMSGTRPMSRLVQGDVGSGKTVVAAALVYAASQANFQSAFMAPTEILARQHEKTLREQLGPHGVKVGLLIGSLTAKERRGLLEQIEAGEIDLVVGTHALISKGVNYHKLGLVITDEQHRFGVDQRSALAAKGAHPHALVMSATPIPRTLALILYGDLDLSIIDERPPGRQEIETYAVNEDYRERITNFTRKLLDEGRQAYYVCPAIESDPDDVTGGLKSVEDYAASLQKKVFPDKRIAILHGKLKPKEKERTMLAFAQGEIDILVCTTVIEVGVDVPNAALMVVENAEHFGLSQLHQLRGRVGRGAHKSYCVLFSGTQGDASRARLEAMCKTNDGFQIAEDDLAQRGPGDFFGSRQHGLPEMQLANLNYNMDILKEAQNAAANILDADPKLERPEHRALKEKIQSLFEIEANRFH